MSGFPLIFPTLDDVTVQGKWSISLRQRDAQKCSGNESKKAWKHLLLHSSVLTATPNTTVVTYLHLQHRGERGGTRTKHAHDDGDYQRLFALADSLTCRMEACLILSKLNSLAHCFSHKNKIIPTEWSLHLEAFKVSPQHGIPHMSPASATDSVYISSQYKTNWHFSWMPYPWVRREWLPTHTLLCPPRQSTKEERGHGLQDRTFYRSLHLQAWESCGKVAGLRIL